MPPAAAAVVSGWSSPWDLMGVLQMTGGCGHFPVWLLWVREAALQEDGQSAAKCASQPREDSNEQNISIAGKKGNVLTEPNL